MQFTIQQALALVGSGNDRKALSDILQFLCTEYNTQSLTSAGLGIKAAASPIVKTGAAPWYGIQGGRLITIAANTDMPALTGFTVANATFNVACFFVNASGTVVLRTGTAGSTLARVVFPDFPLGFVLLGFLIVNPTGTGAFTGGTTALDDATVVPNAVYVSPIGAVDPTILFS